MRPLKVVHQGPNEIPVEWNPCLDRIGGGSEVSHQIVLSALIMDGTVDQLVCERRSILGDICRRQVVVSVETDEKIGQALRVHLPPHRGPWQIRRDERVRAVGVIDFFTIEKYIDAMLPMLATQREDVTMHIALVEFQISGIDNCSGVTATATPESGSAFPVGTNPVEVVVSDVAGLADTCFFDVIVIEGSAHKSENEQMKLKGLSPKIKIYHLRTLLLTYLVWTALNLLISSWFCEIAKVPLTWIPYYWGLLHIAPLMLLNPAELDSFGIIPPALVLITVSVFSENSSIIASFSASRTL